MKKVFNSNEVPHIWAQQTQSEGRNAQGNFYFEGATIYSYGKHFPIATIEGDNVLLTLRTYSNTTAKQIWKTRQAVSHKNIIKCYDVPVKYFGNDKPLNKQSFTAVHENNINYWKKQIANMFSELGNKRNRDKEGRIAVINANINELHNYCTYFGIKIKDKELNKLLKTFASPDFIEQARQAKAKEDAAAEKKMTEAAKAYDTYISLWRKYDNEGIEELPAKTKQLCNYYVSHSETFSRLRFNSIANRLETSKGVQIPAEIAKRAYLQLNGCMTKSCDQLDIPVMEYTITETGKDYIKAGCHTIPKSDVIYIANLLGW